MERLNIHQNIKVLIVELQQGPGPRKDQRIGRKGDPGNNDSKLVRREAEEDAARTFERINKALNFQEINRLTCQKIEPEEKSHVTPISERGSGPYMEVVKS